MLSYPLEVSGSYVLYEETKRKHTNSIHAANKINKEEGQWKSRNFYINPLFWAIYYQIFIIPWMNVTYLFICLPRAFVFILILSSVQLWTKCASFQSCPFVCFLSFYIVVVNKIYCVDNFRKLRFSSSSGVIIKILYLFVAIPASLPW